MKYANIPATISAAEAQFFTMFERWQSIQKVITYKYSNCSILKSITCFATTPPSADDAFFDFDFSSATLHVPAESIDDYKGNSPWSSFGSIVAIE